MIKVIYPAIENAGDILNEDIIETIFNCKVERGNTVNADLIAIGSGLGTLAFNTPKKKSQIFSYFRNKKIYVWGTGFLENESGKMKFFRRNIKICAVRGELSKRRVEKMIGKKLDIPTCDGGILSSMLLKENPKRIYDIGIIPHYKEQDNPIFLELANFYENSIIIDLKKTPMEVIKEIASCKCILSSSLHGLIISDSFHIPNIHICVTNNLKGDGFKFMDYYSGYGINHIPYNIEIDGIPSIEYINKNYRVDLEVVEKKKREMLEAFPFHEE